MSLKPRKRFTPEFKSQAVELLATGKPVTELAQELCISSNLLYNWRQAAQGTPQAGVPNSGAAPVSEADALRALRRENALLRQENDILKKAAVILGTKPLSNSAL
jgi:transposase